MGYLSPKMAVFGGMTGLQPDAISSANYLLGWRIFWLSTENICAFRNRSRDFLRLSQAVILEFIPRIHGHMRPDEIPMDARTKSEHDNRECPAMICGP